MNLSPRTRPVQIPRTTIIPPQSMCKRAYSIAAPSSRARRVEAIAAFTLKPEHEEAIQGGLAHFTGLPLIFLNGDSAVVISYLLII